MKIRELTVLRSRLLVIFGLQLAFVVVLCSGCANDSFSDKQHHFELADKIPVGQTLVEVLELRMSGRAEELSQKMSTALAANKDWWIDYLKKHVEDRPLPYNTNFGISKLEYAEFLDEGDRSRHLQKVSDATLIFRRNGNLLSVDIGDTNSPIEQWRLNLSSGKLFTPTGLVGKPKWESGDDPTQPLGAYEGYSWYCEKSDTKMNNIKIVALWIYRLKANGMMFWRMQDSVVQDNQVVRSIDLKFRYYPTVKTMTL